MSEPAPKVHPYQEDTELGTIEQETDRRIGRFRSVFGSGTGAAVLGEMLDMLDFFEPIEHGDAGAVATRNFGLVLLQACGVIKRDETMRTVNVGKLTNALLIERSSTDE